MTDTLPRLTLTVLRNVMIEHMEPILRRCVLDIGFDLRLAVGEYDHVFQEAVGQSPLLTADPDAVLVLLHLETLSPALTRNFNDLSSEAVEAEVKRIKALSTAILAGIRRQTQALVLWAGFESPAYPALGLLDSQAGLTQSAIVHRLNDSVRRLLAETPQSCYLDLPLVAARVGLGRFFDVRFWHVWRAPYSQTGLDALAAEIVRFLRPLKGKNRKCLVLDCDNTLWGGVVGEEDIGGIRLGPSYPGSAYCDFQREILSLYRRGIILALLSKNNESDVWRVFEGHPDMVLGREHVTAWRIDWNDKAANLVALSRDLNIGLDAMVLADDSSFERKRVQSALPEVAVIELDPTRPEDYRHILASCGLFDTLTLSAEDRARGAMYRDEAERRRLCCSMKDLDAFLRSLCMEAHIRSVDPMSLPRVAQQTQKTNQFNLTTRRYNEAQILALAESRDADVLTLRLTGRFGDAGLVGTCILRYENDTARMDSFLVSCRVLGRGVEQLLLAAASRRARDRGCRVVLGEYYATAKNGQTADFYARMGFDEVGGTADRTFRLDLSGRLPEPPDHFQNITEHYA